MPQSESGKARDKAAARWVEYFTVEAKKRQVENGRRRAAVNNGAEPQSIAKLQNSGTASNDKAAEMFNVSPRSVATAKKLMTEAPEDFKRVEAGEITGSGKITGS